MFRLFAVVLLLAAASECGREEGSLTIRIVNPSDEATFTTSDDNTSFGGTVGGWSVLDDAPTIRWRNAATGETGEMGQTLGTWVVNGGVGLAPGANRLTVHAFNNVQEDAGDAITVIREP